MSYSACIIQQSNFDPSRATGIKRKRGNPVAAEEEIAWTAARYNRLLRSITSRLQSLRRILGAQNDTLEKTLHGSSKLPTGKPPSKKSEHWSSVDPVWVPDGKPKGLRRTYAAKSKDVNTRKPLKPRDGNIAFPSPFIKRIGPQGDCDRDEEVDSKMLGPKPPRRSRQLPVKPHSATQEAETGLTTAMAHVLSSTKDVGQVKRGTRSLLSTCLRRVPEYLDPDTGYGSDEGTSIDEDATTEVLTFLEEFGSREGWVGLREVTRRQCVYLVAKAIGDNIISESTISALIAVCSSQRAISEGQDLLKAWVTRTQMPSASSLDRLDVFASLHKCHSFKLRMLNELGQSHVSNLVRIGSTSQFWKELLSSLTTESSYEAIRLLEACVTACADLDTVDELKAATRASVRDLALKLTVMAAASLLNPWISSTAVSESLLTVTANIAVKCAQSRYTQKRWRLADFETLFMLGSQLLLGLDMDNGQRPSVVDLNALTDILQQCTASVDGLRRHSQMRMYQEDFAGEVTSGILTLEKCISVPLAGKLLDVALNAIERHSPAAPLLKHVALEMATALRQSSNTPSSDVDFEHSLERIHLLEAPTTTQPTPVRQSEGGRFRWEDGLCEWVTATPFASNGTEVEGVRAATLLDTLNGADLSPLLSSSGECSPDVLAPSPPLKRPRLQIKSPLQRKNIARGLVSLPQTSKRVSLSVLAKNCAYESEDELCM